MSATLNSIRVRLGRNRSILEGHKASYLSWVHQGCEYSTNDEYRILDELLNIRSMLDQAEGSIVGTLEESDPETIGRIHEMIDLNDQLICIHQTIIFDPDGRIPVVNIMIAGTIY